MRNDPFRTPRRRRGRGSDIFGQPRRRRFPWRWLLLVAVLAAGGWMLSRYGTRGVWDVAQSLTTSSGDSPSPPDRDAPVVPLPIPPLKE